MPVILAALLVIILVLFALVVLIPISIVQRYRTGTMRRRAQGWLVTINLAGIAVSITLFLISAALTSIWIPQSFTYAAAGVGVGLGIGVIGLLLTRWEYFPGKPVAGTRAHTGRRRTDRVWSLAHLRNMDTPRR
jgi:hypothetical protein